MYIDNIKIANFRTFRSLDISFVHPEQDFAKLKFPKPRLANVNLILGNNGAGKTSLLKCISITALGPAITDAQIPVYRLIRRTAKGTSEGRAASAALSAVFTPHKQDRVPIIGKMESQILIERPSKDADVERARWVHEEEKRWHPIYRSDSESFFFVGYGATRTVETRERFDPGARRMTSFKRAHRVLSLFEESYSLVPLAGWLPNYQKRNRGRFVQFKQLMNALLSKTGYRFTGEVEGNEYLFARGGTKIPFPALSDGYRAFIGWVGDMLYHVCQTCPPGMKLVDNRGIVMVDEIDLHLHPKWQMTILPTLSSTLPNIQFIVTSHSPLVVGSLEWMNILLMDLGRQNATKAYRIDSAVHGLDADQILLTEFFGLESTRAASRTKQLKELSLEARAGDADAAKKILLQMSQGSEADS